MKFCKSNSGLGQSITIYLLFTILIFCRTSYLHKFIHSLLAILLLNEEWYQLLPIVSTINFTSTMTNKLSPNIKSAMLTIGLILLFALEILRIYLIMPFPGSQHANTIVLAFWIGKNIIWLRLIAIALIILPCISIFKNAKIWHSGGFTKK